MRNYAEVRENIVGYIGSWDDETLGSDWFPEFAPPTIAIEITENTGIPLAGWMWNGTIFIEPPSPNPPSLQDIQKSLVDAVQKHLDTIAQTRDYDGILSLCSYAVSTNETFHTEGLAGLAWRDAVWAHCHQVLSDVQAQLRGIPTIEELINELPIINW